MNFDNRSQKAQRKCVGGGWQRGNGCKKTLLLNMADYYLDKIDYLYPLLGLTLG